MMHSASIIDIPASVTASNVVFVEQNYETKVYSTIPHKGIAVKD